MAENTDIDIRGWRDGDPDDVRFGRGSYRATAADGRADQPEPFEEHVEDLRRLRDRLGTDLDALGRRLEALERLPGREAPASRRSDAQIAEKIAAASAALREAGAMRAAVTDALVARAHELPAPPAAAAETAMPLSTEAVVPGRPSAAARARRIVAILGAALVLALVAIAALVATRPSEDGAGERTAAPAPAAREQLGPCSRVPADAASATCFTGTQLTIASGSSTLDLRDTRVRLLAAERRPDGIELRLRMRNGTSRAVDVRPGDERVYLSLDGRRFAADAGSTTLIPPSQDATLRLNFVLDAAALAALDEAGGRVDVGVVPLADEVADRQARVGVIRATVR